MLQRFKIANNEVIPYTDMTSSIATVPQSNSGPLNYQELLNSILKGQQSSVNLTQPITSEMAGGYPDITKNITRAKDVTQPLGQGEQYFQDLISNINAPSSVESVMKEIESKDLQNILQEIEQGTKAAKATKEMDLYDQGVKGPGYTSDIAENALAQIISGGEKTKAQARTQLALAQLNRLAGREKAQQEAYGQRYGAGVQTEQQLRNIGLAEAQGQNQIQFQQAQIAENAKDRLQRGQIQYSQLNSTERNALIDNLFRAILSGQELSQLDKQFYYKLNQEDVLFNRDLAAKEKEAALERDLRSHLGFLETQKGGGVNLLEDIGQGVNIASNLVNIGTGLYGKGQRGGLIR